MAILYSCIMVTVGRSTFLYLSILSGRPYLCIIYSVSCPDLGCIKHEEGCSNTTKAFFRKPFYVLLCMIFISSLYHCTILICFLTAIDCSLKIIMLDCSAFYCLYFSLNVILFLFQIRIYNS